VPDAAPLGYARGVLQELRARHENLSREELLDLVCTLTKEYVLDNTIPFDFPLPERADEFAGDAPDAPPTRDEDQPGDPPEVRFARLIEGMKRRTRLPQLEGFSVEGGNAILVVDNQKVVFGERVTVSLFSGRPGRGRPAPAPARLPSPAPPRSRPGAPAPAPAPAPVPVAPPKTSRPALDLSDTANEKSRDDVDYEEDSGVERFGGLDLD
jgi:hypothetical protein